MFAIGILYILCQHHLVHNATYSLGSPNVRSFNGPQGISTPDTDQGSMIIEPYSSHGLTHALRWHDYHLRLSTTQQYGRKRTAGRLCTQQCLSGHRRGRKTVWTQRASMRSIVSDNVCRNTAAGDVLAEDSSCTRAAPVRWCMTHEGMTAQDARENGETGQSISIDNGRSV